MSTMKQFAVAITCIFASIIMILCLMPTERAEAALLENEATPQVFIVELQSTSTPSPINVPSPIVTTEPVDKTYVVKSFQIPRDLEVVCHKILWYSPLRSETGINPNTQKFMLLWVITNEYECSKVINSSGEVVEYSSLSMEDQTSYNFKWLFPKDSTFEEIMMRPGDHDWYRNAVETDQPWHESEVNDRIIRIWYNVWMSEKEGLDSGRIVPREYIYYNYMPDANGNMRKIALYKTKEDLQNSTNAFAGPIQGTLDK